MKIYILIVYQYENDKIIICNIMIIYTLDMLKISEKTVFT
jgi:hypothetical protein